MLEVGAVLRAHREGGWFVQRAENHPEGKVEETKTAEQSLHGLIFIYSDSK